MDDHNRAPEGADGPERSAAGGSGGDSADGPAVPPVRRRRRRRGSGDSSTGRKVLIGVVVLVLGAAGAWLWLRSGGDPGAAGPSTDTVRVSAPDTAAADTAGRAGEAIEIPPLAASDSVVRREAREVSARPAWESWLGVDDLASRFVGAVVSVAAGSSPGEDLEFMAPEGEFVVAEEDGAPVVDPVSFRRYDAPVAIFASVDTAAAARLYRRLRPLFDEAYRELGFEEGTFDDALARALGRLLAVEVPDGPIEVEADGGVWDFEDPRLEALSPASKHLLRLGPRNARRVQEKLRALAEAVGVEPVAPGG